MLEEWPEEDSDKEMESEMIKLQIEHETEKEERMKIVEMKRNEEDQQFLQAVSLIEKREERLEEARRMTMEARRKAREAKEDEEGWLKEVLRMEEMTPSSPPAPSPSQTAKMPTGKEPCWSMEGMNSVPDRMLGCTPAMVEDLAITKSTMDETTTIRKVQELPERLNTNQAMVEHQAVPNTLVDVTKTNPAMVEPQAVFPNPVDMINTIVKAQAGQPKPTGPAVGLSLNRAKVEYPASTPSLVDVTTTIVNVQEMPRKKEHSQQPSQAELTRLRLDKQRREKRLMRILSSRNLSQPPKTQKPV
jgi:hypothetical protein